MNVVRVSQMIQITAAVRSRHIAVVLNPSIKLRSITTLPQRQCSRRRTLGVN